MNVSYEINVDDISAMADFADDVGNFGVSSEGRLIIANVANVDEIVAAQPFGRFYVEKVDATTLGFRF